MITTIGQRAARTRQVRMLVVGDDRAELVAHLEQWARDQGRGYSPSYGTPVEVHPGVWESIATRYDNCD